MGDVLFVCMVEFTEVEERVLEVYTELADELETADLGERASVIAEQLEYSEQEVEDALSSVTIKMMEAPSEVEVYHATPAEFAESVRSNGLRTCKEGQDEHEAIWCAESLEEAREWADIIASEEGMKNNHEGDVNYSEFIIFRVSGSFTNYTLDGPDVPNEVVLEEERIPPEYISEVETYQPSDREN